MASNRRTRTPARKRKPAPPIEPWEPEIAETVTTLRAGDMAIVREARITRARRRDRKALERWNRSFA